MSSFEAYFIEQMRLLLFFNLKNLKYLIEIFAFIGNIFGINFIFINLI
jgi:hypothetical protein